eukprot:g5675.t1
MKVCDDDPPQMNVSNSSSCKSEEASQQPNLEDTVAVLRKQVSRLKQEREGAIAEKLALEKNIRFLRQQLDDAVNQRDEGHDLEVRLLASANEAERRELSLKKRVAHLEKQLLMEKRGYFEDLRWSIGQHEIIVDEIIRELVGIGRSRSRVQAALKRAVPRFQKLMQRGLEHRHLQRRANFDAKLQSWDGNSEQQNSLSFDKKTQKSQKRFYRGVMEEESSQDEFFQSNDEGDDDAYFSPEFFPSTSVAVNGFNNKSFALSLNSDGSDSMFSRELEEFRKSGDVMVSKMNNSEQDDDNEYFNEKITKSGTLVSSRSLRQRDRHQRETNKSRKKKGKKRSENYASSQVDRKIMQVQQKTQRKLSKSSKRKKTKREISVFSGPSQQKRLAQENYELRERLDDVQRVMRTMKSKLCLLLVENDELKQKSRKTKRNNKNRLHSRIVKNQNLSKDKEDNTIEFSPPAPPSTAKLKNNNKKKKQVNRCVVPMPELVLPSVGKYQDEDGERAAALVSTLISRENGTNMRKYNCFQSDWSDEFTSASENEAKEVTRSGNNGIPFETSSSESIAEPNGYGEEDLSMKLKLDEASKLKKTVEF